MSALDRPHVSDSPADHVASARDLVRARVKLLALAGALADTGARYRIVETEQAGRIRLSVWDPARQHLRQTVSCVRLPEGWRFTSYPSGPVLADADGIAEPAEARSAARTIARFVTEAP